MRTSASFRTFFALTLLVLLALVGCTRRETPAEAGIRTGTLILGNGAEPADLDPQIVTAFTDMNILVALFQGLTDLDERTYHAERILTGIKGIAFRQLFFNGRRNA